MTFFPTLRALEIDGRVRAELVDHLAAGPARRARHSMVVDNCNGADFDLRSEFGDRRKNGRTLGAIRHPVRSILHIASGEGRTVGEKNRRSNLKLRVRGVRVPHSLLRQLHELCLHSGRNRFLAHTNLEIRNDEIDGNCKP